MTQSSIVVNNMCFGVLDSSLSGRFEMPFYKKGFSKSENFYSTLAGALKNRTGFEYVETTKKSLLKEFRFNINQSYLLIFEDKKLSFYTYDSTGNLGKIQIQKPATLKFKYPLFTSNTTDNITVSDSEGSLDRWKSFNDGDGSVLHTPSIGDYIQIAFPEPFRLQYIHRKRHLSTYYLYSVKLQYSDDGVNWNEYHDGQVFFDYPYNESIDRVRHTIWNDAEYGNVIYARYWRIVYLTDSSISTGVKLTFDGQYESDDQVYDSIDTPIPYEYFDDLKFSQNGDVLYITHEKMKAQKLTRLSANYFEMSDAVLDGIDYESFGNPRCSAFFSGRLWYGGFTEKPTTIIGSGVADYENFNIKTQDIKDDDPLQLQIADISDPIVWLYGGKDNLNAGNAERISIINGGVNGQAITPTSVNASHSNNDGCNSVSPLSNESRLFYVSLNGKRLYSYSYDLLTESFVSTDNTVLVQELVKNGIKKIVLKHDKNNFMYVLTNDGVLICFVYRASENIMGFFPYKTIGKISDIECVTRNDGDHDLFISVEDDEGITKYILMRLADEVDFTNYYNTDFKNDPDKRKYLNIISEELKRCNYLDNSSFYQDYHNTGLEIDVFSQSVEYLSEGAEVFINFEAYQFKNNDVGKFIVYKPKTGDEIGYFEILEVNGNRIKVRLHTDLPKALFNYDSWYLTFNKISGLNDFVGKKLSVVLDGCYNGDYEVDDNGEITFDRYCTTCLIGQKYDCLAVSFPIDNQTATKNISKIVVRCCNSAGGEIGTSLSNMVKIQDFNPNGFFDKPAMLLNGDKHIPYSDVSEQEKRYLIMQNYPLPFVLTMIELTLNNGRLL